MLDNIKTGKVIMKRKDTGKPLMVEVPYGRGRIYYTSFHNHAQASEREIALLNILVLTQLSEKNQNSIQDMAALINFQKEINEFKNKWGDKTEKNKTEKNKTEKKIYKPSNKKYMAQLKAEIE